MMVYEYSKGQLKNSVTFTCSLHQESSFACTFGVGIGRERCTFLCLGQWSPERIQQIVWTCGNFLWHLGFCSAFLRFFSGFLLIISLAPGFYTSLHLIFWTHWNSKKNFNICALSDATRGETSWVSARRMSKFPRIQGSSINAAAPGRWRGLFSKHFTKKFFNSFGHATRNVWVDFGLWGKQTLNSDAWGATAKLDQKNSETAWEKPSGMGGSMFWTILSFCAPTVATWCPLSNLQSLLRFIFLYTLL